MSSKEYTTQTSQQHACQCPISICHQVIHWIFSVTTSGKFTPSLKALQTSWAHQTTPGSPTFWVKSIILVLCLISYLNSVYLTSKTNLNANKPSVSTLSFLTILQLTLCSLATGSENWACPVGILYHLTQIMFHHEIEPTSKPQLSIQALNPLNPGRFEWNFRYVIFKRILMVEASLVKSPSYECHWTSLMISQHWFR